MNIITVKNLKKVYDPYSAYPKTAINNLSFHIKKGEFIAIMGSSGSGKTTLINMLSAIDTPTNGEIMLCGKSITLISEKEKADIRKKQINFIFQNYNLIATLNNRDNILFSMRLNNIENDLQQRFLTEITEQLHIEDILHKFPFECSGGQQQRVAIARALIMHPKIIFADEPTGNLDSISSKELMELFVTISKKSNTTIVMVTHDSLVASYATKMFYMQDGDIIKSINRCDKGQEQYYQEIISITSPFNIQITKNT